MSEPLRLLHEVGRHLDLYCGDRPLFRYVYQPATAERESPRPYFHPLTTLAGHEVTLFRPHDHVWHHGLSMTCAQLSGQNFWGGPTYLRDRGYVQLPNNGTQRHHGWTRIFVEDDSLLLLERLEWVTQDGEPWLDEDRLIEVREVDQTAGWWSMELVFKLRNAREEPLVFGSPTTEGRPAAGYGGLFWRGPRSFRDGRILAAGGLTGEAVMGQRAPWLAYVGQHDGSGDAATLLILDHPQNLRYPTPWFVRNQPYGCASCAFSFDEELALEPGEALALDYRLVVADGAWTADNVAAHCQAHPVQSYP